MKLIRPSGALLLALVLPASLHAQASFAQVPEATAFTDLTPDGKTGLLHNFFTGEVWLWTAAGGLQPIGTDKTAAEGLSSDGTAVAATSLSHGKQVASRWTAAGGWKDLGALPGEVGCDTFVSSGFDVSGDGSVLVGLGWAGCKGRAIRWTPAAGMIALPQIGPGSARANCISNDGRTIGGWDEDATGPRRPSLWLPDGSEILLGGPEPTGEVQVLSDDGKVAAGDYHDIAYYWTEQTGIVELGLLPGGFGFQRSGIYSMAGDGHIMGGMSGSGGDPFGEPDKALIWTPEFGLENLKDRLITEGADVPDTFLMSNVLGISDDGRTLVGWGIDYTDGFGQQHAWVATLAAQDWSDAGHALPGGDGVPHLVGAGTQIEDTKTKLIVHDGQPDATSYVVVGASQLDAPVKGGVLVPSPDILAVVPLDADGGADILFRWPKGVPAGTSFWWQTWIADPAGPAGYSATNALHSVSP